MGVLPWGKFVSLDHPGGVRTTYLDLEGIGVRKGQRVRKGQLLGTTSCGHDPSSSDPHLHFGAYMNGHPIDPRMLIDGFEPADYIYLSPTPDTVANPTGGSPPRSGPFDWMVDKVGDAWGATVGLFKGVGGVIGDGTKWLFGGIKDAAFKLWEVALKPAAVAVGRGCYDAFKWILSNKWAKGVIAGLAAAALIAAVVITGGLVLGIALPVIIAGVAAGAVACIGYSLYYAAYHGSNFSFGACFLGSLAAGAVAATAVVGVGYFSSAIGAIGSGLSKVGLLGLGKSFLENAVISTGVELLRGFLMGDLSWKNLLVAFVLGGVCGTAFRSLRLAVMAKFRRVVAGSFLFKLACSGLVGTMGVGAAWLTCLATGRSFTLELAMASFFVGALFGALTSAAGERALESVLGRIWLKLGRDPSRFGRILNRLMAGYTESLSKQGYRDGLHRVLKKMFRRKSVEGGAP